MPGSCPGYDIKGRLGEGGFGVVHVGKRHADKQVSAR